MLLFRGILLVQMPRVSQHCGAFVSFWFLAYRPYTGSLRLSFGAVSYLKLHLLTFFQGLPALHVDSGEMDEDVFTFLGGYESIAFGIVEPFYDTALQTIILLYLMRIILESPA